MIQFEKKFNRLFLNDVRRAIDNFHMINPNDKVAVALSGGKDSIFTLFCLKLIQLTYIKDFELYGIHIGMGFEDMDMTPLINFCSENNIQLIIENTNIAQVIFNDRKEKNPCSLCSRLRRGALSRVAKANDINKIALGHNSDDVVETLMMNVLKVGKLGTFHPNIYRKNINLTMIRPLIYIREDLIEKLTLRYNLPIIKSTCPEDKKTTREDMKKLLISLEAIYPDAQEKIIKSLSNVENDNLWTKKQKC